MRHLNGTRRRSGARRHGKGQSLVEFAVTLPIFMLLLAGILDFGIGLYSQMTVINAAREGARFGVVTFQTIEPGDVASIKQRVIDMSSGLTLTAADIAVTCKPEASSTFSACSTPGSGDAVRVQVDYDYQMIFPLAFGTSIPLSSSVQMRIE